MTDITPSDEQAKAIRAIVDWYGEKGRNEFYLAGFAGVGKSTIAALAIEEIKEKRGARRIRTAAYTGKAASVLRKKGNETAQTIHSLIYLPKVDRKTGELTFLLSEESDAADADLIVLDECFSGDTLLDTPKGRACIRDIKPGDEIFNAWGVDTVVAVMKKEAKDAVQVKFGGETVTCSANHRFFTARGLVHAAQLRPGDTLVGVAESMRLLRDGIHAQEMGCAVLHRELQHALVAPVPGISGEALHAATEPQVWSGQEGVAGVGESQGDSRNRPDCGAQPRRESVNPRENQCGAQGDRPSSPDARGERQGADQAARPPAVAFGPGMGAGIRHIAGPASQGLSDALQARPGESDAESRYRTGRPLPFLQGIEAEGRQEDQMAFGVRVDSVEVLELGDPRLDRLRDAGGKLYLHDIQAARHSSFAVSGVLVHNCSMIDDRMASDLRSFGKKILIMGDPGQLPPVNGQGAFTRNEPDVFLHEIHRQAADSPILELATLARQGERLPIGYSKAGVQVRLLTKETQELIYRPGTQPICGLNRVRWTYNRRLRARLGHEGPRPLPGEKLICCKNNHKEGIFNGGMGRLVSIADAQGRGRDVYSLTVAMEDSPSESADLLTDPVHFNNHFTEGRSEKVPGFKPALNEFDFGYIITCHKAQGSQWDDVTVVDDSVAFRENRSKWLYTAATRAETGLTILLRD